MNIEKDNKMKKTGITISIYTIILCLILISFLGYTLYRDAIIFPPTAPSDLTEISSWSENDLWRLMQYYKCSDISFNNIPDDLKELKKFCSVVSDYWSLKYNDRLSERARDAAKRLKQIQQ